MACRYRGVSCLQVSALPPWEKANLQRLVPRRVFVFGVFCVCVGLGIHGFGVKFVFFVYLCTMYIYIYIYIFIIHNYMHVHSRLE